MWSPCRLPPTPGAASKKVVLLDQSKKAVLVAVRHNRISLWFGQTSQNIIIHQQIWTRKKAAQTNGRFLAIRCAIFQVKENKNIYPPWTMVNLIKVVNNGDFLKIFL
jgi:hypothetical protein